MTTDRDESGGVVFVCDACPETLETGYSTWGYANDQRREAGWVAEPLGTAGARGAEEWAHYCPDCAGLANRANRNDFKDVT